MTTPPGAPVGHPAPGPSIALQMTGVPREVPTGTTTAGSSTPPQPPFPADMQEVYGVDLPVRPGDAAIMAAPIDHHDVNYHFRQFVADAPRQPAPSFRAPDRPFSCALRSARRRRPQLYDLGDDLKFTTRTISELVTVTGQGG
ncbi:hypothetical protein OKW18_004694 [Streptomyces pratensis]|jgi:hypothetical protein|nr:hypothetical protein [Streptomyces pratensis]